MSPWARIDDKFHSHPKRYLVPLEADGLFVRALSYAADHLTDGFVPDGFIAANTPSTSRNSDPKGIVKALVMAEMFTPVSGGYRINDYLEFNPSRADVERARADRSAAGKKGADSRWHRDSHSKSHSKPHGDRIPPDDAPRPIPSHTQEEPKGSSETRTAEIRLVFEHWVKARGKHPSNLLTAKRATAIRARLREGYTVERLCRAIDGVANDPWEKRAENDGLEMIFRDVEKFEALASTGAEVVQLDKYEQAARRDYERAARELGA